MVFELIKSWEERKERMHNFWAVGGGGGFKMMKAVLIQLRIAGKIKVGLQLERKES